ncbi:protein SMAX1-LIKE 3-like isoform X2 [Solanum lycopersicum]|uniref:protein SMAX1-LIKE 3-like isoform X2 n=1 Tax=Solanum lycopersicum TaxID=4081 RepID=UPI000E1C40A0|nr:protein SMAX1-LIKE 3-like isoform X2 [Solanum lycopersicum]
MLSHFLIQNQQPQEKHKALKKTPINSLHFYHLPQNTQQKITTSLILYRSLIFRKKRVKMRTNVSFQQALTVESSSIVKQALNLAKRRGHSHVTPLHVASALLVSSSSTLLRKACFQTNSHPIQYKALELCFNVALNRLPTSASSPILEPHVHPPLLSNALNAAFKRAQAYQRRGSVENQQQQQHLKVEIDQLVISILDDPSVSRVMSEAGFSSIQLKTNVEHAISSDNSTKPIVIASGNNLLCKSGDDSSVSRVMRETGFSNIQLKTNVEHVVSSEVSWKDSSKSMVIPPGDNLKLSLGKSSDDQIKNDDVMSVIDTMMNKKRRNTVIVAECLANAEGVVRGVVDKFDKGEVSSHMKHVQFISVPLSTLRNVSKEEFESKIRELRILLKRYIHRGVVLYLGDLEWISEFWTKVQNEQKNNYMILELTRLLCGEMSENRRLWLMGIASFSTYTKCKTGYPSLQTLWDLHPLTLPVVSLDLSLNLESSVHKHDHNFIEKGFLSPSSSSPCSSTSISKKEHQFLNTKPELLSNPNSIPNSASSSETSGHIDNCSDSPELLLHSCQILQKCTFSSTFLNSSSNVKIVCKALEEKVPWQKDIIHDIVSTILECRHKKEETWLLFLGVDTHGKEKISKELAKVGVISRDLQMQFKKIQGECSSWKIWIKLILFHKRVFKKLLKVEN